MKNFLAPLLFFLTVMTGTTFGQGDAPPFLKGQAQSTSTLATVIEVPANQATKITSSRALLETGNKNLLVNPSFEHVTPTTGWTINSGSAVVDTTNVVHGSKALSVSGCISQSTTRHASQFASSVQGIDTIRIKTAATDVKLCSINAGVISTTNCVTASSANTWGLYKVPFVLGSTSNGISICSATNSNFIVDDGLLAAADILDTQPIIGPWYSYTPTFGAGWGTASSINVRWRQVGSALQVEGRFVISGGGTTGLGSITLPTGYTIDSNVITVTNTTSAIGVRVGLSSGDSNGSNGAYLVTALGTSNTIVYRANMLSGASNMVPATALTGNFAAGTTIAFDFTVPVTQFAGSTNSFSSNNADTDWAPCSFSTLAWQGLGTVTNTLRCKREGSDLLMTGKVTIGTVAPSEIRIPLPLWYGSQLSTASASKIPQITYLGHAFKDSTGTGAAHHYSVLAEASLAYLFMGYSYDSASSINPLAKGQGSTIFGSGESFYINNARIPIADWETSNVIVGTFKDIPSMPGAVAPETFIVDYGTTNATTVCSATPCSYLDQLGSGVTEITRTTEGVYAIRFPKTYSKIKCVGNGVYGGGGLNLSFYPTSCFNCNALEFKTVRSDTGNPLNSYGTLYCAGKL